MVQVGYDDSAVQDLRRKVLEVKAKEKGDIPVEHRIQSIVGKIKHKKKALQSAASKVQFQTEKALEHS